MIELLKRNKESIVVGVFTTFICFVITSIFNPIGVILVSALTKLSSQFSDYYYTKLSKYEPIELNSLILAITIISAITICPAIYIISLQFDKNVQKIMNFIKNRDESYFNLGNSGISTSFMLVILILNLITYPFLFFYDSITVDNIRFKKKIIAIKPFISDKQADVLNSQWVLMKTKKDFDAINNQLNKIIKFNKLNY